MPATPNKLNLSFARNAYNALSNRTPTENVDPQVEQKKELLEGKIIFGVIFFLFSDGKNVLKGFCYRYQGKRTPSA